MRKKLRFVMGVVAMVAAIGYLIFAAVRTTSEYYLTVNEVRARQAGLKDQMIRVAGRVVGGAPIAWDPTSLTLDFSIAQIPDANGSAIKPVAAVAVAPVMFHVISRGQPKPDMFAPGRDVIVEGKLGPNNTIEARQVLTSCPSKYVPKQPN